MKIFIKLYVFSVIGLLSVLSYRCEKLPNSPATYYNDFDTTHSRFVYPSCEIISGPVEGSTITSSSVTFDWQGNEVVGSYQYRLDSADWSPWITQTSVTLQYLDDMSHYFQLRSRHRNNIIIETEYPHRSFNVDYIKGPSLLFFPMKKLVSYGTTFNVDIRAEEINIPVLGVKATFQYNQYILSIDSISHNDPFLCSSGHQPLFIDTIGQNNGDGQVVINLIIVGGNPKGITGSGTLATLHCTTLNTGTSDLSFHLSETVYRDTTNNDIIIKELVNGIVEIN